MEKKLQNGHFTGFLKSKSNEAHSRYISKRAVFADRINRIKSVLFKESVFKNEKQIGLMKYQKYSEKITSKFNFGQNDTDQSINQILWKWTIY